MKSLIKTLPLVLFACPLHSQCSSWDEGARKIENLMNRPEISKSFPPPEPLTRLEYRLYSEEYAYSKPIKRYLLQVIPENGEALLYSYDTATDKLSHVTNGAKFTSKFCIEYQSTQWFFFVSAAANNVRVD